jgi:ketosteroid isomerase-like protein
MDDGQLRAMFSTIDAMDWEALAAFFHEDIVYERPGFPELCGIPQIMRFYREERKILQSAHWVQHTVIQDKLGAAWGRVACVLQDGTQTELGFADVYQFDDELVTLRRTHFFVPAV